METVNQGIFYPTIANRITENRLFFGMFF